MPNRKMDPVEVEDAIVGEQWALSPGFKLLSQGVIETTDRAGAGSHSHQRLGHFSDFLRTDSCHEHLRDPFGAPSVHSDCSDQTPAYGTLLRDLWEREGFRWDPTRVARSRVYVPLRY